MKQQVQLEIDRAQALRYLGVREEPDTVTVQLMERAEKALFQAAKPHTVTVQASCAEMAPYLQGEDIARHLSGCEQCVLLGCTLGAEVDRIARAAAATDMTYAVVLDAMASVLAEAVAEQAEQQLRAQLQTEGQFLTGRFSPGYGDWSISVQNDLIRLLDAPRKIGLCATATHLLVPRKSITAVLGVADHPVTGQRAGCAHCALREHCSYHKEGKTCESGI